VFVVIVGGGILLLGVVIPFLLVRFRKQSWQVSSAAAEKEAS
jgi:hypothetical protein